MSLMIMVKESTFLVYGINDVKLNMNGMMINSSTNEKNHYMNVVFK